MLCLMLIIASVAYLYRAQLMRQARTLYINHKKTVKTRTQRQRYHQWRANNPAQAQQAQAYMQFLTKEVRRKLSKNRHTDQVTLYIPPAHELFYNSHAVKKSACNLPPFHVPSKKHWKQLVPTIVLINQLQQRGMIGHIRVTSGYRDIKTNRCVGGSRASKHMKNAALDFRLRELSKHRQSQTQRQLCQFWQKQGKKYRMGLGTYGRGRYHIDTQGYRTWGKDFKRQTSLCLL